MNPKPTKNISKSKSTISKTPSDAIKKETEAVTVKNYRLPSSKKEELAKNASEESILIQNYLPPKTTPSASPKKNLPNIDHEGPEVDFEALENVLEKTTNSNIPDSLMEEEDIDPEAITVFDPDPDSDEEQESSGSAVHTILDKNAVDSENQTMLENKTVLEEAQTKTKVPSGAGTILAYQKRRYRYIGELGSGGMGQVFKAMDLNLKREIAVKVLGKNLEKQEGPIGRFLAEAQITSQLEHPNIIPVHELGSDRKGQIFFTMKKVEGKPLSQLISRLKASDTHTLEKYTVPERLRVFRKICDAVAFAHASKVIHRDLKPDNIMIGKFGEVLVMDWGLAKVLDEKGSSKNSAESIVQTARQEKGDQTLDGAISGTPLYMSPEQAEGRNSEIRETSDIYSLGSILFEMLTYSPPVQGKNIQEILKNVMLGKLANVETPPKNISPELLAIAQKCLQLKPAQRYSSVEALAQDIDAYLDDRPVSCYPGNLVYRSKKWIQRHPTLIGISSTIISFSLLLLVTTSYFFYKTAKLAQEKEQETKKLMEQTLLINTQKELELKRNQAFLPFSEAVELIRRQEKPEQIFEKLQQALAIDSSFYLAVVETANFYEKQKNGVKAIEYFQKALDLYQQQHQGAVDLRSLFHIGFISLYQLQEKAKAITLFETIDRYNQSQSVYTLLAQAYLKLFSGNLSTAMELSKQAHMLDESRWEVHTVVAEIHSLNAPAEEICDTAHFVTTSPRGTGASTMTKPGQPDHWSTVPIACWNHAIHLVPEMMQAYINRGAVHEALAEELFQSNMTSDARTHLEKAKQDYQTAKEKNHPQGYIGLVRILLKEEQLSTAESLLGEFQRQFPNQEQSIRSLQQTLEQKKNALNQSVELRPQLLQIKKDRVLLDIPFPENTVISYFWISSEAKFGINRYALIKNKRIETLIPPELPFPATLWLTVSLTPEEQSETILQELKQPKYSWKKWDQREERYFYRIEMKSPK